MLNKFFLDADYNVKTIGCIQRPFDDIHLWNNSICFEIMADSTANQYLLVEYGENQSVTLEVEPGEKNEIYLNSDYYWNFGGVTHVTPYKNGSALTAKKINITFPDIVESAGTISSTESNADGSVKLGNDYEMAGSYYVTPETIKEVEEKVDKAEQDIEDMGDEIDTAKGDIEDLKTDKQDVLSAGTGISIASDTVSVTHPIVLSTEDLTPNVSPLPTGTIYLVYE